MGAWCAPSGVLERGGRTTAGYPLATRQWNSQESDCSRVAGGGRARGFGRRWLRPRSSCRTAPQRVRCLLRGADFPEPKPDSSPRPLPGDTSTLSAMVRSRWLWISTRVIAGANQVNLASRRGMPPPVVAVSSFAGLHCPNSRRSAVSLATWAPLSRSTSRSAKAMVVPGPRLVTMLPSSTTRASTCSALGSLFPG
jgi:hypothetical protein